jgi:hypothetical protein
MLSLLLASVLAGLPPSQAAATAYEMACNKGELRLDPSEAKVTKSKGGEQSYQVREWGYPQSVTTIDLTYPPYTTIDIATYDAKDPKQIASACVMYTKSMTREDAIRALLADAPDGKVGRDLNPARWNTPFEMDRPQQGYRKDLKFDENNLVIIQTDMYKAPHK